MITKFKSIKCHGCGKIVSITYEKFNKNKKLCSKCEEKEEEKLWNEWLDTARESLNPDSQEKWDKLNKNVKKAFILKGIEEGTIKIG